MLRRDSCRLLPAGQMVWAEIRATAYGPDFACVVLCVRRGNSVSDLADDRIAPGCAANQIGPIRCLGAPPNVWL